MVFGAGGNHRDQVTAIFMQSEMFSLLRSSSFFIVSLPFRRILSEAGQEWSLSKGG